MSKNHDASIKNLEVQIGQLSRQIVVLSCLSGGFVGKTVENPKNESCKVVEIDFEVATNKGEDEIIEEDFIEKE